MSCKFPLSMIWVVLLFFPVGPGYSAPVAPRSPIIWKGVFLSPERLAVLKTRVAQKTAPTYSAFLKLRDEADAQLDRPSHAPTDWYVPAVYVDGKGHTKAKAGLADDANSAYALALMYRMTEEEKYAVATARLINGWATGVRTLSTKDDSQLSFCYHFPALIFAADLLKGSPSWPSEQQQAFKLFVKDKALPMNTMDRANNWGNWGLVLYLAGNAYLEDKLAFKKGITRWKIFVEEQLADDGHLPKEVARGKPAGERGLWYSHFSLMPQTLAAEIARVNGVDLYEYRSPSGRTLRTAFERLAPWTRTPASFPYFKGDDPQVQKLTDYISYWEILHVHWPNADAEAMLAMMRPLTANHSTPHLTFTHGGVPVGE